jgi:hypothetical protein
MDDVTVAASQGFEGTLTAMKQAFDMQAQLWNSLASYHGRVPTGVLVQLMEDFAREGSRMTSAANRAAELAVAEYKAVAGQS